MGDSLTPARDEAPLSTSKRADQIEDATLSLVETKGDSLSAKTVTINRPRRDLYDYWRALENLPNFMENVERVEALENDRYRWVVKAPAGKSVEWIAAITEDRPGEVIAWVSEDGADVPNSGRIDFRDAPGGRGSWVTATILYDPPGGMIGKLVAKLFQREPAIQARRDLRRFKQLMETGEIATAARTTAQLAEEMD
ncbi:SRPBCC family protein [Sphingobium sp.]|uniref:SRPBCC family protein n=1 Tax=Sphingobium sp. TaxID=1912891 RepID=UPI002CDAE2A1|nr:SRPBCC family protein [Sphingobium sp.]HUD91677.1 SRPBCC family protein [Sphingobium sp.]